MRGFRRLLFLNGPLPVSRDRFPCQGDKVVSPVCIVIILFFLILSPKISEQGFSEENHALKLWKRRLKSIFWMDGTAAEEPLNGPSGPRRKCAVQAFWP